MTPRSKKELWPVHQLQWRAFPHKAKEEAKKRLEELRTAKSLKKIAAFLDISGEDELIEEVHGDLNKITEKFIENVARLDFRYPTRKREIEDLLASANDLLSKLNMLSPVIAEEMRNQGFGSRDAGEDGFGKERWQNENDLNTFVAAYGYLSFPQVYCNVYYLARACQTWLGKFAFYKSPGKPTTRALEIFQRDLFQLFLDHNKFVDEDLDEDTDGLSDDEILRVKISLINRMTEFTHYILSFATKKPPSPGKSEKGGSYNGHLAKAARKYYRQYLVKLRHDKEVTKMDY